MGVNWTQTGDILRCQLKSWHNSRRVSMFLWCVIQESEYVHLCRNIDKRSSHDYQAQPAGKGERPRWFPSHAHPLHNIQWHISLIRVRGLKIQQYMSRRRVITNVSESQVRLIGGVMWCQQVWLHPVVTNREFENIRRRYPRALTEIMTQ